MLSVLDDAEAPPIDPPEDEDGGDGPDDSGPWATVCTYWNASEAQIARLKLEAEDIPCVIFDENLVATNWLWASAVGGIKLMAPESRVSEARDALQLEAIDSMNRADGAPLFDGQQRCPRCGSDDIYVQRVSKRIAMLSILLLGLPIPLLRPHRRCAACGADWPMR